MRSNRTHLFQLSDMSWQCGEGVGLAPTAAQSVGSFQASAQLSASFDAEMCLTLARTNNLRKVRLEERIQRLHNGRPRPVRFIPGPVLESKTEHADRGVDLQDEECKISGSSGLLRSTQVNRASESSTEHAARKSRSPRREMQNSCSLDHLRSTEVNAASGALPSLQLCSICQDNPCTIVGIPCGHFVLCESCLLKLEVVMQLPRCVICRSECTFYRVFPR